ncbi:MAG: hypothetical protein WKF85_07820 [Chitinophagaceae bacterium]
MKASITLIILILTIFSCKKEEQYMSNAEIIGYDAKTCPCCGGIKIAIDNAQNPNGNTYFLIDSLPSNFTIGDNPKFPIAVKLDWKIDTDHCFGSYIDITRIAKR